MELARPVADAGTTRLFLDVVIPLQAEVESSLGTRRLGGAIQSFDVRLQMRWQGETMQARVSTDGVAWSAWEAVDFAERASSEPKEVQP